MFQAIGKTDEYDNIVNEKLTEIGHLASSLFFTAAYVAVIHFSKVAANINQNSTTIYSDRVFYRQSSSVIYSFRKSRLLLYDRSSTPSLLHTELQRSSMEFMSFMMQSTILLTSEA